jgi:1-phosphofructokinase
MAIDPATRASLEIEKSTSGARDGSLLAAIDRTVTISNFKAGAVNRVENVRSNPGGKGVNVASALADQGHGVAVTGFLGRSNAGAFEELFSAKRIADHFVRIAGQTRIGIKVTDPVRVEIHDTSPGVLPRLRESVEGQGGRGLLEIGFVA